MKNKKTNTIFLKSKRMFMRILPACAMAMTLISANATACWIQGQPEPPANLKNYRKF